MQKTKNKHGLYAFAVVRESWPRGPAIHTLEPPPGRANSPGQRCLTAAPDNLPALFSKCGIAERDGPGSMARGPDTLWPPGGSKAGKRPDKYPRDFIRQRRTGESPPAIVVNFSNTGSKTPYQLPRAWRLRPGESEGYRHLTATLMSGRKGKK